MKPGEEIGSKANVHFASRAWETTHCLRYIPVTLPILCLRPLLTVDISKGISSIHDLHGVCILRRILLLGVKRPESVFDSRFSQEEERSESSISPNQSKG